MLECGENAPDWLDGRVAQHDSTEGRIRQDTTTSINLGTPQKMNGEKLHVVFVRLSVSDASGDDMVDLKPALSEALSKIEQYWSKTNLEQATPEGRTRDGDHRRREVRKRHPRYEWSVEELGILLYSRRNSEGLHQRHSEQLSHRSHTSPWHRRSSIKSPLRRDLQAKHSNKLALRREHLSLERPRSVHDQRTPVAKIRSPSARSRDKYVRPLLLQSHPYQSHDSWGS